MRSLNLHFLASAPGILMNPQFRKPDCHLAAMLFEIIMKINVEKFYLDVNDLW